MTSYTTIANSEIDQDSPVTEPLLTKIRDNPIAIAEAAAGAPKIKRVIHTTTTATLTITDLDGHLGLQFTHTATEAGGSSLPLTIEYSTDNGSNWSSTTTIVAGPQSGAEVYADGFIDLTTGEFFAHGIRNDARYSNSGTISGASSSINAIRFSSASDAWTLIVTLNGGIV